MEQGVWEGGGGEGEGGRCRNMGHVGGACLWKTRLPGRGLEAEHL
jgi:hypothetical protein